MRLSPWLKLMLAEIERKSDEQRSGVEEQAVRDAERAAGRRPER